MTTPTSPPVARLSSPGDIVATVPLLCGFTPQDSVVVLSLRGDRRRLGLTVRLDLPPPVAEAGAATLLAARVAADGARAAAVVVFGGHRRPELVGALEDALEERGVQVAEALHVADGRWTSYLCAGPCCPAGGTPVPAPLPVVAGAHVLEGRAVLASRDQLVQSLAAGPDAAAEEELLVLAGELGLAAALAGGALPAARRRTALEEARALLEAAREGRPVERGAALALAVALHDVAVRDRVVTWAVDDGEALLSLAEQVARLVPAPWDAPVCCVLAWVAYARGDGARTNVALDRALSSDPACALARLLRAALDAALPPEDVRRTLRATGRALSSPGSPSSC